MHIVEGQPGRFNALQCKCVADVEFAAVEHILLAMSAQ